MSITIVGTVKIKSTCTQLLKENSERISVLFSAQLSEKTVQEYAKEGYSVFEVCVLVPGGAEKKISSDFVTRLQVGYERVFLSHSDETGTILVAVEKHFVNGFDPSANGDNSTFTFPC